MSSENTPEGRVKQLVIRRQREIYIGLLLLAGLAVGFSQWRHANYALVGLGGAAVVLLAWRLRCPRCERFVGHELWTADRCRHCSSPFDGRRARP